jgi:hypothetical protein
MAKTKKCGKRIRGGVHNNWKKFKPRPPPQWSRPPPSVAYDEETSNNPLFIRKPPSPEAPRVESSGPKAPRVSRFKKVKSIFNNSPSASLLPPPPEPASGEEELEGVPVSKIPPTNYKFRIIGRRPITIGTIELDPDNSSFKNKYTIVPPTVNPLASEYIKDIEPGIGFPELANEVDGEETSFIQYTHGAKLAAPINVRYVSEESRFPKIFVFPIDTPVAINYSTNTKRATGYYADLDDFTIAIDIRYLRSRLGGGSRRKSKHCRRTRKRKC